jgi:hypothetical protein
MRKEIAQWNPSHWSIRKLRIYTRDVRRHAILACTDLVGPYNGAVIGAELLGKLQEIRSSALLRAAGIKTLSDGGA